MSPLVNPLLNHSLNRLLTSTLVLLGLTAITSCRPDSLSYSSDTSTAPGSGMVAVDALPVVNGISSLPIMMEWEFASIEADGSEEHLIKTFHADGTGNIALDLTLTGDGVSAPIAPTPDIYLLHNNRQIYLALYRNISVTDPLQAEANYIWFETLGTQTIAGQPCTEFYLDSKFDVGDAKLWIDQNTGIILAWTLYDPADVEIQNLQATLVDYQPNLSGVTWAVPQVPSQPYDPKSSNRTLGFKPHRLVYGGPGFDSEVQTMLITQSQFPSVKNMHLSMLTDGLRTVFVAQQRPPEWALQPKGFRMGTVSFARVGGVSVMEGLVSGHWVFCVGSIPADDLLVLANSLRRS